MYCVFDIFCVPNNETVPVLRCQYFCSCFCRINTKICILGCQSLLLRRFFILIPRLSYHFGWFRCSRWVSDKYCMWLIIYFCIIVLIDLWFGCYPLLFLRLTRQGTRSRGACLGKRQILPPYSDYT